MTTTKMTAEQERWILSQVKPAPEVFILAYAGTSYKEWKLFGMVSRLDYFSKDGSRWEADVMQKFPSATLIKVFIAETPPCHDAPDSKQTRHS